MSLLKYILKESEDFDWDNYEELDQIRQEIIGEALTDLSEAEDDDINQEWSVANFNQIQRIWKQYAELGFVRDTKNMESISELFIRNIIKLDVNTELAGHKSYYPLDDIVDMGITDDYDEAENLIRNVWDERIFNYIFDNKQGQMRISDYAMEKLLNLGFMLNKALTKHDHELMLRICDRILNVVHQRSNIAEWFVDGGVGNLDTLAEE